MKKRLAEIVLFDEDCDIYLEIMSCEKQINDLVHHLSTKYFMKKIFVNTKDEK